MKNTHSQSQQLRETARAMGLTYDKTAGTFNIDNKRHKLDLATVTYMKTEGLRDFVELARQIHDGSQTSDYNVMSSLFAPWSEVLEFQHLSSASYLHWKRELHTPQDMHANQFVSLFDFLAWLHQAPSCDP